MLVPIWQQRHFGALGFLAYSSFMHQHDPPLRAVVLDLSCVGGHYHASALQQDVTLRQLHEHIESLVWCGLEEVDVWVGSSDFPASEGTLAIVQGSVVQ